MAEVPAPRSRELASFLARLRLSDLPSGAVELLKLCVLDHLGCAIGALGTETARIAWGIADSTAGGACTAIGCPTRTGPEAAALANGTLSHALIFDDLHRHAKLHPGVAVIPAALASAELAHADGRTFLARVDPRSDFKYGDNVQVVFNADNVHLFDKGTEKSIL